MAFVAAALVQAAIKLFQSGPRLVSGDDINAALNVDQTSLSSGLTATGAVQGTALALTSAVNQVSTAVAGTGVLLPKAVIGQTVTIYNDGANPITVYGNGTDQVDGAASVPLANTRRCAYTMMAVGQWESAQLGAVSA